MERFRIFLVIILIAISSWSSYTLQVKMDRLEKLILEMNKDQ